MKLLRFLAFFLPGLLASTFPVLSFYSANIAELSPIFLNNLLPVVIAASFVLSFMLLFLTRNQNKASLLAFILSITFYSYGHLSRLFNDKLFIQLPNSLVIGPDKILLPLIIFMLTIGIFKILKSKLDFSQLILYINLALGVLIAYLAISSSNVHRQTATGEISDDTQQLNQAGVLDSPDIYHIILDGYAREDVLREIYNYDNREFIQALEELGFFVANRSRANYIHTHLSLPSTFNMTYLDFLAEKYGKNPSNEFAALDMMKDNEVSRKLKGYGYSTINFATWWAGTDAGYPADISYNEDKSFKLLGMDIATSETNMVFLQTTLLSPLIKEVLGQALRGKVLYTLQKLPDIPYQSGKKYTLAHIITPHPPYLFNADGSVVPNYDAQTVDEGEDRRPLYLNQVTFISRQILPILRSLIKNSPTPPIIILQSDHGPASLLGERETWRSNYSSDAIFERSSILYAVFLPDANYQDFSANSTPVNTYRIIFNRYFDTDYSLLTDKTYFTIYEKFYDFEDVTDFGIRP